MAASTPTTVLLPLKLDAFALNPSVCAGGTTDAKIAPITQPNYTFLRLSDYVIQNDILPHTDLHTTDSANHNPRLMDLGSRTLRANRQGIYLSWMVPRAYRSGVASTRETPDANENADNSAPQFRDAPVRWLVIRTIDMDTVSPSTARDYIPELHAWVVESDRRWSIDELDETVDLQVDVSPFIDPGTTSDPDIDSQAEVFIGLRADAVDWEEQADAPRVPMSLLNSANHLFPDFQPHNSNVFSMVDSFDYLDADQVLQRLDGAIANYYVIGWHVDETKDLFYIPSSSTPPTQGEIIAELNMTFSSPPSAEVTAFLASTDSARLLCHGAMYNVVWSSTTKPESIADKQSAILNNAMPVAVGTTPLDALLTYVQAHKGIDPGDIAELEEDILRLQALLLAQSDTVDAVREAADELGAGNYERMAAGIHYHFAGEEGAPPTIPTESQVTQLRGLNQMQYALDVAGRTAAQKQWELFACWWKYVSDVDKKDKDIEGQYQDEAAGLSSDIKLFQQRMLQLQDEIDKAKSGMTVKAGVIGGAFQTRDPTLLVGGIESGWPYDYLDNLLVRLQTQVVAAVSAAPDSPDWRDFIHTTVSKLPTRLQDAATALLQEFPLLSSYDGGTPPEGAALPLYHDHGADHGDGSQGPARDQWNETQPWFPLFLEWEAEYTHIPFELWTLSERTSRASTQPQLHYGIPDDTILADKQITDIRTVSGRVLILPQPSFSLAAKIDQVFATTPPAILDPIISPAERQKLKQNLYKLPFLSAPLAGLTDHLLTLVQGTHIKPMLRKPGEKPTPMPEAVTVAEDIGFDTDMMGLVGKETDLTPYGTLVQFLGSDYCAFKPVTHGQLRFTKLNIIDKFGQAIHAIDPIPQAGGPPPLYPAISDFYAPRMLPDGYANTVVRDTKGFCEFIQLPPAINQPARLSSSFVMLEGGQYWRPATEWENPIWGWIIINFADRGLQLFLADGTFYREIRLGGQSGTATSSWLPFDPPATPLDASRLDLLVEKLQVQAYAESFMSMVAGSLAAAPAAPSAYSEFLNSIIGKPFALTTMGWALELSTDALENQSTLNTVDPDRWLLPGTDHTKTYSFPVKIGDADRSYDGLVGYFLPSSDRTKFDLSTVHTFFGSGSAVTPIDGAYPTFAPFWTDPKSNADDMDFARNQNMQVFGAIVDPFRPVHGYSSFLPPAVLTLPPWTWQEAIGKMTAFFRIGPLVVTKDVPAWDKTYELTAGYDLEKQGVVPKSGVGIPVGIAEWAWLQPYVVDGDEEYMPLGIGKGDGRPRFEEAPYTTLEGYLQLKGPIFKKE